MLHRRLAGRRGSAAVRGQASASAAVRSASVLRRGVSETELALGWFLGRFSWFLGRIGWFGGSVAVVVLVLAEQLQG